MTTVTSSEKQTLKLGEKIACQLKGGEVLALTGELGTGKTVITKGIARFLGIKKHITSPTFVLMKLYPVKPDSVGAKQFNRVNKIQNSTPTRTPTVPSGQESRGSDRKRRRIKNFLHIDAYRLNSGRDLLDIGLEDWLNRPDTIIVIEWAERVRDILSKKIIKVNLKIGRKNNERIIKVENIPISSKSFNLVKKSRIPTETSGEFRK
ncbi:MAG: tRNA (adenosine(37)-N6)-threonylcarbamoyltransferase complex ATPase subunit type 1 TsaE [Patescibacteria group bacterium]